MVNSPISSPLVASCGLSEEMNDLEALINKNADLETIIGRKTSTSVSVHGILIPVNSLLSRLHIFGQNLVRFTHVEVYEIQLIGSATGVEYRGSRNLICTEHQVRGIPGEDIGIIYPEKQIYISSAGYVGYKASDTPTESDATDLRLFDFNDQIGRHPGLAGRFFKLTQDDFLSSSDNVLRYFAYGCPFADQNYDVIENNRVDTIIRSMVCEPEPQPTDDAVGACRMRSAMNFDPNGLSGGPVFATVFQDQKIVLKFAGVINRAGNGIIKFIKAEAVRRLLDLSDQSFNNA